jgi:D-ribose pyranase
VGVPGVVQTLTTILQELHIEGVIVAEEMERRSPLMFQQVQSVMGSVPIKKISHEEFKQLTRNEHNISFVRTGEATPFANVILVAGVVF